MVESVKQIGVKIPVLVRLKQDGGYEMVSGHRRNYAVKKAGLIEIPAIIREMTDEEAIIVMVDSNIQREKVLPSEKAFAYKMKLDAIKSQGKRTDLEQTSDQVGRKLGQSGVLVCSLLPASFCTQKPFRWAEYAPGADYCPPRQ